MTPTSPPPSAPTPATAEARRALAAHALAELRVVADSLPVEWQRSLLNQAVTHLGLTLRTLQVLA